MARIYWVSALMIISATVSPAFADDSSSTQTAKVTVTVVFPETLASFDDRSIKVFLDKADPAQPGANVTTWHPIDTQVVDHVSHTKGTESKQEIIVGAKATLDPNAKYMVMARILDASGKNKGVAMADHKPNVVVLTGGSPTDVSMTVAHLAK